MLTPERMIERIEDLVDIYRAVAKDCDDSKARAIARAMLELSSEFRAQLEAEKEGSYE